MTTMAVLLNVSTHSVDLDDGREIAPGEWAEKVDIDIPHNATLLDANKVRRLDAVPKDSPRADNTSEPAAPSATQPAASAPEGNA